MPAQPASQLHLESIVTRTCLINGAYDCAQLDPLITAAEQELDDAVVQSSSALGHSSTISIDAAQAKLNRYLEAQALCHAKYAAAAEDDATAATIANARMESDPMQRGFNFNNRCIE